jgi:transposase InsO family protein
VEALSRYGRPEIFNTDQGSQFTSEDFTGTLKRHGIMISMDGKSLPSRKRGPVHGQHLCRATVAQSQI